MADETMASTRRALHAVAELLIAGPQYQEHGTIRLAVTGDGIGGVRLPVQIEGAAVTGPAGRVRISGTVADIGAAIGIEAGAPLGLYHDTSGVEPGDAVEADPEAAKVLLDWFVAGDQALRAFADDVPVLWPEHFDLGISLDEVNYGVSPGDAHYRQPYAYVGPWQPRTGPFWNASFGAVRTIADLDGTDALLAFFIEGRKSL